MAEPTTSGEIEDKVREVLAATTSLYLSTTSSDQPWIAGAFFAESDPFTLSLVLESHGRTLTNIRSNPRVAVMVCQGAAFEPFLQGDAEVSILPAGDETEAVKQSLLAKVPAIAPLLGAPIHAVRLTVASWRATDVAGGWLPARELARAGG